MPGPVGRFIREGQKTFLGGVADIGGIDLYAKDPLHRWKEDWARTLGSTIFNVGTFFAPELKVGNAAKAGKFGRAAEVVAKATDPLVLLQRTAEAMKSLKGVTVEGLSRLMKTADHLDDVVHFDTKVDIDLPSAKREDTGTNHTNLGDRNHADAPAPRDRADVPASRDHADVPAPRDRADVPASRDHADVPAGRDHADAPASRDHSDAPGSRDHDQTTDSRDPASPSHQGSPDPSGPVNGGSTPGHPAGVPGQHPTIPDGQKVHPWEDQASPKPGTHMNNGTHPEIDLDGKTSRERGQIGEALTKQRLIDDGWTLFRDGGQTHIKIPGQKGYFVPDFIAVKDGKLMLVESKTGLGAHFTGKQLDGYGSHGAQGSPRLTARSSQAQEELTRWLDANGGLSGRVDAVQVDRWNVEIVPDPGLLARATTSKPALFAPPAPVPAK